MEYGEGSRRVLLHPAAPRWLVVNASGYAFSTALLQGSSPEDVAADVCRKYGIARDEGLRDVLRVRDALEASKFFLPGAPTPRERTPEPRSLFLHLTHRCNLSCRHCYVGGASTGRADLPVEKVMDLLRRLTALGGRFVTLSGGEPLLHPDIEKIMACARPALEIRLLTNGTLIDRERALLLKDHDARVQVSLDGSIPAVHDAIRGAGSFDPAVRGIEQLRKAGLGERINIATTVMRQNLDDLPSIIALAEGMGVPLVRFLPLRKRGTAVRCWGEIGEGLSGREIEEFYDFAVHRGWGGSARTEVSCGLSGFVPAMPEEADDDIWCPVGRQLVVDVDGGAYPCAAMMTPELRLGSVFAESVEELFTCAAMKAVCRALTERRRKIDGCAACVWRNLCQSGCMALALEHRGTIWDVDDFCAYRKKLYKEAFDRILALEEESPPG